MATTLIRVTDRSRSVLQDLARRTGHSRPALVEAALEEYRRRRFFLELDEAFVRLYSDPDAQAAEVSDRRALDGTLADGLSADNGYDADGPA